MTSEIRAPLIVSSKGTSSYLKTCFNGTNAFLGIGLLTVPYALSNGGWLSLLVFFFISMISLYTAILLKRCLHSDPSLKTYLDIANQAYGTRGKILVSIIMNMELYLVAIGLLILESDNLYKLFPGFEVSVGGWLKVEGRVCFVIITALIILPSVLLTDLSLLSYVSATGVFSCLVIFVSILCVGAFGGVGFHGEGATALGSFDGILTAISLYIVCFAGHPVIPSIYDSMQHNHMFTKVLMVSFLVTIITYASTGIVAYLMYGDSVESQITLNLPTSSIGGEIAIYTTLLIPVTRYALMVTPVASAIESALSDNYQNQRFVKLLIRIALLISTVFVACIFPYYESLMAIVGSIFVVLGSFLIPCACYLKIVYRSWSWNCELMSIVGIILFGCFAGFLGTYSSISQLQN